MVKRIIALSILSVLMLLCTSCGNLGVLNKETVSVKDSDLYENFHLKESALTERDTFSKDGIKVSLRNIDYCDVVTKIVFDMKNETDKNVKIVTTDLSINDIMCTDSMMTDLNAKSQKESFIEISNSFFAQLKIDTIKDLEYVIRVLGENSDELAKSDVLKASTDAPSNYKQSYINEGFIIYNEGGIVFVAHELKKSKLSDDFELSFYLENNTDEAFSVMAQDVSVNDKIQEPTFVITVGAKKRAVDTMLFKGDELTESGITEIADIKASFKGINNNLEPVFETEIIKIPVK